MARPPDTWPSPSIGRPTPGLRAPLLSPFVCVVSARCAYLVRVLCAGLLLAWLDVLGLVLVPLPLVLFTVVRRKEPNAGDDWFDALHGDVGSGVTVMTEGGCVVDEEDDDGEGE